MTSVPRARSYGISKSDMEASRLVFVFVRDAKPKRKVAVPVPDGYTWSEFLNQVKNKLKIVGVKEIYLAASGQKVTSLDELQDIDELCVVEGQEPVYSNGPVASISTEAALRSGGVASTSEITAANGEHRQQFMTPEKHKVVIAPTDKPGSPRDYDEKKYTRRVHPLRRVLQRLLPSVFAPSLPITNKDAASSQQLHDSDRGMEITRLQGKRRKVKRSVLTPRTILMVLAVATCLATMIWFMFKAGPKLS